MWDKSIISRKVSKKYSLPALLLGISMFAANGAFALTANEVLTKMSDDERFAYVSGIVDGLAFARWIAEKPSEKGMKCIHNWYYGGKKEVRVSILNWLERHPDKPVDALMYILVKNECGK